MLVLILSASIDVYMFFSGRALGLNDHNAPYWEQPFSQPYFDNTTRREVTTTVGQTAHLHCRVRNLGDRAVHISNMHSCMEQERQKPVERDVASAFITQTWLWRGQGAQSSRRVKSKNKPSIDSEKYILSFYVMLMTT